MTNDLINIENDQSQLIMDRVEKALNEKGIVTLRATDDPLQPKEVWFIGMGNKRMARIFLPSQKDLSEEQIQEKASEIVKEVESKIRAGGDGVEI